MVASLKTVGTPSVHFAALLQDPLPPLHCVLDDDAAPYAHVEPTNMSRTVSRKAAGMNGMDTRVSQARRRPEFLG